MRKLINGESPNGTPRELTIVELDDGKISLYTHTPDSDSGYAITLDKAQLLDALMPSEGDT